MQGLSTVQNLPLAKEESDAVPLVQVKELIDEAQPIATDLLAAYILAKS
ncbi:hypothetical protein [Sphingomonas hankookensis]